MKIFILFLTLFIGVGAHGVPQKTSFKDLIKFDVHKFQLDNGLTVLIHEDHSVPILSFHQWYRVGSRDEKPGRTGLAHFFEHLMFKGTQKYNNGEFDRLIQANGGENNAFTSNDYTGYYMNMPSNKLELAIDLESDRMRNLMFEEVEIKSEREVVKEERRYRVDNSIMGFLRQRVFSTVFKVHPYRWPVIGYMRDLNAATMKDLKEFYRIHYAPNNSVIVISGAIDKNKTEKLVRKYYGDIPSQKLPEQNYKPEPEQKGARVVNLRRPVQSPVFSVVYKSPKAGERDAYVLDVLSEILGSGNSSRLYKRLVYRGQLASSISSFNYTPKDPGIFQVTATMRPEADMEAAISAVYGEIYKMRAKKVTEAELEKAKNQLMSGYVSSLKTVAGKARALAVNEILFGDYTMMFKDLDQYQTVTAEEVQEVAKRYLPVTKRSLLRVTAP